MEIKLILKCKKTGFLNTKKQEFLSTARSLNTKENFDEKSSGFPSLNSKQNYKDGSLFIFFNPKRIYQIKQVYMPI